MSRGRWTETDYARYQEQRAQQTKPARVAVLASSFIVIPGEPQAKPRQTQRDKWQKRPVVEKYREWADHARKCLQDVTGHSAVSAGHLDVAAYFAIPRKCKNPEALRGTPHLQKPDLDNIIKAVADALIIKDQRIHEVRAKKRWDDGHGPRIEVSIYG